MAKNDETVLQLAELLSDSTAMNQAALVGDFDEARFRAQLIANNAQALGHLNLALVASQLLRTLGPAGTNPRHGYGAGMLQIASELERIGFSSLSQTRI